MRPDVTSTEDNLYFSDPPLITKVAETTPVAAKPYVCNICGNLIAIGERHNRFVYRDDDALDSKKALKFTRYHTICPPPVNEY